MWKSVKCFNAFVLRKCESSVMRRRPEDLDEAAMTFKRFWGDLDRIKESKHYLKGDISYTCPWNIVSYTASLSPDVHLLYVTQSFSHLKHNYVHHDCSPLTLRIKQAVFATVALRRLYVNDWLTSVYRCSLHDRSKNSECKGQILIS